MKELETADFNCKQDCKPQPPDPQAWENELFRIVESSVDREGEIQRYEWETLVLPFIKSLLSLDRQRLREAIGGIKNPYTSLGDSLDNLRYEGYSSARDDIKRLLEEEKG